MKQIKTIEKIVLDILEKNLRSREDDFILYGAVLRRVGIDLKNTNLYYFLANAKGNKCPSFETVAGVEDIFKNFAKIYVGILHQLDKIEKMILKNITCLELVNMKKVDGKLVKIILIFLFLILLEIILGIVIKA